MTSIRALLETHTPIPAIISTEPEGYVLVENPDFRELIELAGGWAPLSPKVRAVTDTHIEVETKDSPRIAENATWAIRVGSPPSSPSTAVTTVRRNSAGDTSRPLSRSP